jgi:hypothetical protein
MSAPKNDPTLAGAGGWGSLLGNLATLADEASAMTWNPDSAQVRCEIDTMLLAALMRGYAQIVYADPDYPEFVPSLGLPMNVAAPVPDFLYKGTPLRGNGVYRISGHRGASCFVDLFTIEVTPTSTGAQLNTYDLNKLRSEDGRFEVVLSNERPAGHAGDWWYLDPRATQLVTRCAAYDWSNEVDPVLRIERLDIPARRPRRSPEDTAARLERLATATRNYPLRWLKHMNEQKARGVINRLEFHDYSSVGGAAGQVYLEGIYELAEDEALLVETEVPQNCRYWSFLASDELFCTLDWMHRFSSINGHQARLDGDGRFRMVVSARDTGAPNWIDIGEHRTGFLQGRWNNADSAPMPACRKVKASEVWQHLPAGTSRITTAERDALLRVRREGAQRRRFW